MNRINIVEKEMTGADIGKILGISRAAVSQILKKSISKIYFILKNKNKNISSTEILCGMAKGFNLQEYQYKKFFKLFPKEAKEEIKNNLERYNKNGY